MDPLQFFAGGQEGLTLLAQGPDMNESEPSRIHNFVRTPEGRGLGIVREDSVESWHLEIGSTEMKRVGKWQRANLVVVLDHGRRIALYTETDQGSTLTLHQALPSAPSITTPVPRMGSLFSLPSSDESTFLIGIAVDLSIIRIRVSPLSIGPPSLTVLESTTLTSSKPLRLVIPVDPMAWSYSKGADRGRAHDVILSIDEEGELAFWTFDLDGLHQKWNCTGRVATGRRGYRAARCSSAKKSVLGETGSIYNHSFRVINNLRSCAWDSRRGDDDLGLQSFRVCVRPGIYMFLQVGTTSMRELNIETPLLSVTNLSMTWTGPQRLTLSPYLLSGFHNMSFSSLSSA